uniref:Uncharacterized protein n=1 Tax=Coptotermes formosanus TaxID=36987 RepID=R4ULX0_COPFO|nr:hypothetical protein [Coptotermes formosanus]
MKTVQSLLLIVAVALLFLVGNGSAYPQLPIIGSLPPIIYPTLPPIPTLRTILPLPTLPPINVGINASIPLIDIGLDASIPPIDVGINL